MVVEGRLGEKWGGRVMFVFVGLVFRFRGKGFLDICIFYVGWFIRS